MISSIYIVDDDDAVRDSIRILLEAHGYDVQDFAAGIDFLVRFDGRPRACLVLDINMPNVGGIEILQVVRARWPALPVIMISGRGDKASQTQALGHGAVALLEKPFGDLALIHSIEKALSEGA